MMENHRYFTDGILSHGVKQPPVRFCYGKPYLQKDVPIAFNKQISISYGTVAAIKRIICNVALLDADTVYVNGTKKLYS